MTEGTAATGRAKGYKELVVWQRSVALAKHVYQLTQGWPPEERFGITSQIRRAAISIPSNLAEGQGRFGPGEFARFVSIAHGSLCELETQLIIATEIGIVTASQLAPALELAGEIGRMLRALHRSLQA